MNLVGTSSDVRTRVPTRPLLLLLDDDALLRNATSWWVARPELVAVHAASLAEARVLIEELGPEIRVAVIDYRLPDGSGLDAVNLLRTRNPNAQILVYTGFVDEASRGLARHDNVGIIPKGRDPRYIQHAVALAADLSVPPAEERQNDLPPLRVAGRPLPPGWFGWALPRRLEHLRYEHDLSLKELDAALAAARGGSNADAAAQLAISVGAIKARLGKVYRKLGLTDRSQLQLLLG